MIWAKLKVPELAIYEQNNCPSTLKCLKFNQIIHIIKRNSEIVKHLTLNLNYSYFN